MKQWIILFLLLFLFKTPSYASSMSNDVYKISQDQPDEPVQTIAKDKKEQQPTSQTTFLSSLFEIKSSSDFIDYGQLYPTEPIIRNLTLSALSKWPYGFYLTTHQNYPLKSSANTIPNTSCDNGSCTQSLAAGWNSILTYGFGYQCRPINGVTCAHQNKDNSFLSFANKNEGQTPEPFFSSNTTKEAVKATAILKINTPKSQSKEIYQNTLYFVAIPKL